MWYILRLFNYDYDYSLSNRIKLLFGHALQSITRLTNQLTNKIK